MLSWDSLERSEDNNEDDDGTRVENNNCYGNGDGRGDGNTGDRGGLAECLGFLSPSAPTEALGVMAKAKASLSTKSRKKRSWEKVRIN